MYLKEFSIEHFRLIEKLTLNFRKGVNIIIGENNAGKTAIIDALRICLSYGSQSREIYIKKDEDFYIDCNNPTSDCSEIRFDLLFEVESSIERAIFIDFIKQDKDDPTKQTIELHFKYFLETKNDNKVLRWRVWGGENEGQPLPVEALQLISHTYLDALRNASEKLRPHSYDNKIAKLFKNLKHFEESSNQKTRLDLKKRIELAKNIQDSIQAGDWNKVIATGNKKVLEHITHSAINGKEPNIEFSFLPYTYEGIVDNIQARKPIFDLNEKKGIEQRYFRVSQNGLGENNLIYAGTVLGDLISQNDTDDKDIYYNALLIEEPEAHLHPQKQNTFFKYLSSLENSDIQIFMTSHSPTITAKSNLDFITILQRQGNRISAFSINNSELNEKNKIYLSKFLDVTKSQLFFANGTILVEGISEALLLPVFSIMIDEDLDKNGVEVVNLNGVAFEHFAKLFNSENEQKRLLARCTLLTDDDNGQITDSAFNFINKKKTSLIFKKLKDNNNIDTTGLIQSVDISAIDFGDDIDDSFVSLILKLIKQRKTTDINCGKVETNEIEFLDVAKKMTKDIFKYLQENGVIDKLNRIKSTNLTSLKFENNELKNHIERILIKLNGKYSERAFKAVEEYSTGNLQTKLAEVTFEYALMIEDEQNYRIIKGIYQEIHPDTDLLLDTEPLKDRAMNLLLKLYSNKDKSELAHRLAVCLESNETERNHFKVPCYIKEGIKWVTKGTN